MKSKGVSKFYYTDDNGNVIFSCKPNEIDLCISKESSTKLNDLLQRYDLLDEKDIIYSLISTHYNFLNQINDVHKTVSDYLDVCKYLTPVSDYESIINTLALLYNEKDSDVRIFVGHKDYKERISFENPSLIIGFRKLLFEKYMMILKSREKRDVTIENPKQYFSRLSIELSRMKNKGGAPRKNEEIGMFVAMIHKTISQSKRLNTKEGILVSRKQSRFIIELLQILDYPNSETIQDETNIRHILKTFNKNRPDKTIADAVSSFLKK